MTIISNPPKLYFYLGCLLIVFPHMNNRATEKRGHFEEYLQKSDHVSIFIFHTFLPPASISAQLHPPPPPSIYFSNEKAINRKPCSLF